MKNKIKIVSTLAVLLGLSAVHAQGGFLMSSVKVVCSGAPVIVVENGKWSNSSSTFNQGNSKVKFTGNAAASNSTIAGGNTTFYDLEIAKSANNVQLVASSPAITNSLIFTSGNLDLSDKTMLLNGTSVMVNESETSRTVGIANGNASKTKTLNNPASDNVGNLGMTITATGNLGLTTISRYHPAQTLPTGSSILKYWNLSAASPSGWNATLRFNYFEAELNGLNENLLVIWRSTDNGATWTEMFATVRNTVSNFVELSGITDVSGRWTLGTTSYPLHDPGTDDRSADAGNSVVDQAMTWVAFPNPTSNLIHFSINSEVPQATELVCIDMLGQVLLRKKWSLEPGLNNLQINVNDWLPGNYVAKLSGMDFHPIQLTKLAR